MQGKRKEAKKTEYLRSLIATDDSSNRSKRRRRRKEELCHLLGLLLVTTVGWNRANTVQRPPTPCPANLSSWPTKLKRLFWQTLITNSIRYLSLFLSSSSSLSLSTADLTSSSTAIRPLHSCQQKTLIFFSSDCCAHTHTQMCARVHTHTHMHSIQKV